MRTTMPFLWYAKASLPKYSSVYNIRKLSAIYLHLFRNKTCLMLMNTLAYYTTAFYSFGQWYLQSGTKVSTTCIMSTI